MRTPLKTLAAFAILLLNALASTSEAFPEMARHSYTSCTTCHVSPTGGGVMTEYGRSLSKEVLSTWGRENEERFLYVVPGFETVALGGDIRWIYLKDKSPTRAPVERDFWMQRDFEAALILGKWTVAATAGLETDRQTLEDRFISRRHYAIYQATDEVAVRAGRFYPQFGLNIPDHNTTIRRGIGWDQSMETYNLEGSWLSEKWIAFATAIFGRPDDSRVKREAGVATDISYNLGDTYRVGLSQYYGETDEITRHLVGPYAALGFSKKLYLLAQINAMRRFPYQNTDAEWGVLNYTKFGYEPFQGIHFFVTQEFQQSNLKLGTTRMDVLGAGIQFFPRPHWEFQTTFQKAYSGGLAGDPSDRFFFLAHFYL